jgi:hypothetical protein
MTRSVGRALPEPLWRILDGTDPEAHVGVTIALATPDPSGWPLIALLSTGEILAPGPRDVRIGLWASSTTTAALSASGRTTMSMVHDGAAWDVHLRCERAADIIVDGGGHLAAFRCAVEEVLEDRVGYAVLVDGIRYRLHRPEQVLPRWTVMLAGLARLEALVPLETD